MKTRRHPRTGLKLTRTQCNRCGKSFAGRVLLADQAYCPECTGAIVDRENGRAKFAPGKQGTIAPNAGTEDEA